MNQLRLTSLHSISLGFLLLLNMASTPTQAMSFKKLCALGCILAQSADGWSLNGPNPLPVNFIEGQQPTFPAFNQNNISALASEGPFTVNFYTLDAAGKRIAVDLDFMPNQLTWDAVHGVWTMTASSATINQFLASLRTQISDLHRNGVFALEMRVYNGTSFQATGGAVRDMVFSGTAVNTAPEIPLPNVNETGIFIFTYDGRLTGLQNTAGGPWGLFDDIDRESDPTDPGIELAVLQCAPPVETYLGGDPCPSPCVAPYNLAKGGAFGLKSSHRLHHEPKCSVSVIDSGSLSSPIYNVAFVFTAQPTWQEDLQGWLFSFKGFLAVVSGVGTVYTPIKIWKDKRQKISPYAAAVGEKADIAIWRFSSKRAKKLRGPEPLLGICFTAKSNRPFPDKIEKICKPLEARNHAFDDITAAVADEIIKEKHEICEFNSSCIHICCGQKALDWLHQKMFGKYIINLEKLTSEKIQELVEKISDDLETPASDVELSVISSQIASQETPPEDSKE